MSSLLKKPSLIFNNGISYCNLQPKSLFAHEHQLGPFLLAFKSMNRKNRLRVIDQP